METEHTSIVQEDINDDKLVKSLWRATLSILGARNAHGANKTDFLRNHQWWGWLFV